LFTSLEYFSVSDAHCFKSLKDIECYPNLYYLAISEEKLESLDSLKNFASLKRLSLNSIGVSDISALSELKGLTLLSFSDNDCEDISSISGLTELTSLTLSGNDISDVSALASVKSLKEIDISDNKISDISVLKNMTGLLGAAEYVETLMNSAAAGLANFLPAIIFLVACVLAFSTGTSWGTFGILIPIVAAIFDPTSELMIIGMSACLAGAVCGDHCSPISDTTIMSSAGARCDHINHVSTQLPYAITVAAISFVGYIIAGFVQNAFILLPVLTVLTIGTLFVIKAVKKKKA
jgi:hypothetical protein